MATDLISECSLLESMFEPLLNASNTSTPEEALETLIEVSRTKAGRTDLAKKNIIVSALQLCQNLSHASSSQLLFLALKLVRNLCAGERINENLFLSYDGVGIILSTLDRIGISDSNFEIIRIALQVLANVSLAGEMQQIDIWSQFFPIMFTELARVRWKESCDPLCLVIYNCCSRNVALWGQLYGELGLPILKEIVRTASTAGFGEELSMLLGKICLEEYYFPELFSRFLPVDAPERDQVVNFTSTVFAEDQAFLLSIVSEMVNKKLGKIAIPIEFATCVFEIFKRAVKIVDDLPKEKSGLPTGSPIVDVLGYSLTILRDICAVKHVSMDRVIDSLLSSGLIEFLLSLLGDLEPIDMIKKAMQQSEEKEGTSSKQFKPCPYRGFRRDIVAVIGNCAFRRKRVQDEVRELDGILLILQQGVSDEENPFLREWGIWAIRNLLEGNMENQKLVAELELQSAVDVPEIARLGMRVEVDPISLRAKLVNV